jgi:aryl-alcohol dehydrogenase-like predicted oxidoreductase
MLDVLTNQLLVSPHRGREIPSAMAVERGVNLIDTADAYSQGRSDEVVG